MMEYTEYTEETEEIAPQPVQEQQEPDRLLVDALPYIDAYDDNDQNTAQELIRQEMRSFSNGHKIEPVTVTFSSDSLNKDWARIQKTQGTGFTQPLNPLEVPVPGPNASLDEWLVAVEKAKINYEYVKNRLEMLELQQQFGANSWLEHNKLTQKLHDHLKETLQGYKTKMEQINIKRKTQQLQVKSKLETMEAQWLEITRKNAAIEQAILQLEADLK